MSSAFRGIYIVYKAVNIFCIGIIVLHCNLYVNIILCSFTVNNFIIDCCFALVHISDKFFDSALIVKCLLFLFFSVISQNYLQIFCEKCCFLQTHSENFKIIHGFLKNLRIRQKSDLCSMLVFLACSHHIERIHDFSSFIALLINLPVLADSYL